MKERESYFDNAKFMLIAFVVFGHFIQSLTHQQDWISSLYKSIYSFHMPAFIVVSGFFAKKYNKSGYVKQLIAKLILPYLIFQLIYSIFYFYLYSKQELVIDPFFPHWSLWFLVSLFFWNLMLVPFTKIPRTIALFVALGLGIAVGFIEEWTKILSLARTVTFFPFFLLGYYLQKRHFTVLKQPFFQLSSVILFALLFVTLHMNQSINEKWFLGSESYHQLSIELTLAPIIRLFTYFVMTIMVCAFFALVPKRRYFFTKLGKNTLYVYLLHGFVIRAFRESSMQYYFKEQELFIILIFISFILTLLLSSNLFRNVTKPLIEPKIHEFSKSIHFLVVTFSLLLSWRKYDKID